MEDSSNNPSAPAAKLPYFHRTLSEEDRRLVGDTTPKKIGGVGAADSKQFSNSESSAWNASVSYFSIYFDVTLVLVMLIMFDYFIEALLGRKELHKVGIRLHQN